MKPVLTAQRLIRAAFAALFGVMSLAHGPVMAAAHSTGHPQAAAPAPMAAHHGAHHHAMDHATDQTMPAPDEPEAPASGTATCYSFACFLAVASPSIGAPATSLIPLGQLAAHPPQAGSPTVPEPADPPPRLQV
jgi:hypothetical protein